MTILDIVDDEKIQCELCDRKIWFSDSSTVRDEEDNHIIICSACMRDIEEGDQLTEDAINQELNK